MGVLLRGYDRLIGALAALAGLLIAAVCLLIAWDVIARNLGFSPPASTVALTEYALLYFTMLTAPWLVRRRGHIVVEIVYRRLPARAARAADRVILLLCTCIALLIAGLALILAAEAATRGEIEVRSLDMPRWALFAPVVVGFTLMATEFVRLLLRGESVLRDAAASAPGQGL